MTTAFLDNSIVIGFCFTVHQFHPECERYVTQPDVEAYITETVDDIYRLKQSEIIEEYATDILDHQAAIQRGDFPEQLGPMDIRDAKRMIHKGNSARRFLLNWYENEVGQFIEKQVLTSRLRTLARDVEQNAADRKEQFDDVVQRWAREEEHEDVQTALADIRADKAEDMWICIDAHDLAVHTEGHTELATSDVNDFIQNDRKELILEATQLDDVVPVIDDTR